MKGRSGQEGQQPARQPRRTAITTYLHRRRRLCPPGPQHDKARRLSVLQGSLGVAVARRRSKVTQKTERGVASTAPDLEPRMPTLSDRAVDDTVPVLMPADDVALGASGKSVFLDPTERRRRAVRLIAIAACTALAGYGALLVASLLGVSVAPHFVLPLSGGTPPAASSPSPLPQPTGEADAAVRPTPAASTAVGQMPTTVQPGSPAAASVPSAAPPVAASTTPAPPGAARNTHAPASPPGQTKRGVSTP